MPASPRFAARARTLALAYLILLFVGTHVPMPPEQVVDMSDKLLHFSGYALLTVVVLAGWELSIGVLEAKHYFAVWLAGTLYGAIDELTQPMVGRTCDVNDWAADVAGLLGGLLAFGIGAAIVRRLAARHAGACA
ncbi:MAG: VanZ family protein [Pirellulales bacterium]|nr:VanZ family protein [Pirellulales bacterium]